MDCREARELLIAFHDGELPEADRARIEAHLGGCADCRKLLSDLGRADDAVGVPDPGPEYWARFDARVMERVGREADGSGVATLRPKRRWWREQWPYLVPAVAAAALVAVVVRHSGFDAGSPQPPSAPQASHERGPAPSALPPPVTAPSGKDLAVPETAPRPADAPVRLETPAGTKAGTQAPSPPAPAEPAPVQPAPPPPAPAAKAERYAPQAPAPAAVPAPPAYAPFASGGAAFSDAERNAHEAVRERKSLEIRDFGKAKRSSEESVRAGGASVGSTLAGAARPGPAAAGKSDITAGIASESSRTALARDREPPCDKARRLYSEGRFADAEVAQRACLASDASPERQDTGTVFLAELLDRQSRFAEADALLAAAQSRYPASRALEGYRQQRPAIQRHQPPAAR